MTGFNTIIFFVFVLVLVPIPVCGSNSDFSELPHFFSLREIATAHHTYQQHNIRSISYVRNVLVPGFIKQDIEVIRYYDPQNNTHEVIPKYTYRFWSGVPAETGGNLDFHIDSPQGRGFFVFQLTKDLKAYTRDGRFRIDHKGRLITISGSFPVLNSEGGHIFLKNDDVTVSRKGTIYNEGINSGILKVVVFKYIEEMKNAFDGFGTNMFILRYPIAVESKLDDGSAPYGVLQGFITQANSFEAADSAAYKNYHEASNVALGALLRTYDKSQRIMLSPN